MFPIKINKLAKIKVVITAIYGERFFLESFVKTLNNFISFPNPYNILDVANNCNRTVVAVVIKAIIVI